MSTRYDSAADLLIYYMRRAWEEAGLGWESDNNTEIRNLVDHLEAATSERIRELEQRIKELEGLTSVYGETLDDLRNRAYALEHGQPRPPRSDEDDDGSDYYAGDGEGITGLHWDNLGSGGGS